MKNSILLKIYFFYIFLCTALPCPLFAISYNNPYTILAFFPFVLSILVGAAYGVKLINKSLLIIFVIVIASSYALHNAYGVSYSPYLIMSIYVAYICFQLFKKDIIDQFVCLSYKLTVVGLFLWVMTILSPNLMTSIANAIGYDGFGVSQSLYIFNVNLLSDDDGLKLGPLYLFRNNGYCWEAGRYSCFMLISIYFYAIRNGLSFKNKKILMFVLALITTQSTTGYMVFLLFIAYWYLRGKKVNPIYYIIIPVLFGVVWSLPFIRDKIFDLLVDSNGVDTVISNWQWMSNNKTDEYMVPQRFTGFWLQWVNLQNCNLWIGDSSNISNHYIVKVLGINAAISEGILAVFVRYGIFIGVLAYYTLTRSSLCFAKYFGQKQVFLLAAIFIGINFSYNFWENPLMITFWMWSVFSGQWMLNSKKEIRKRPKLTSCQNS